MYYTLTDIGFRLCRATNVILITEANSDLARPDTTSTKQCDVCINGSYQLLSILPSSFVSVPL